LKGISQSLIIARIGLSRLQRPASASKHTALVFADSSKAEVRTELVIKGDVLPEDDVSEKAQIPLQQMSELKCRLLPGQPET
jgi:hypothetical protein